MPKNTKIKSSKKEVSYTKFREKILFYEDIITKTQLSVDSYKTTDIINASEFNICIQNLEAIYQELNDIKKCIDIDKTVSENNVNKLQKINDDLSVVFKTFGTRNIFDLLTICFGTNYVNNIKNNNKNSSLDVDKIKLIDKYIHPISYKVLPWKNEPKKTNTTNKIIKNKILEDFMIIEMSKTFDCYDLCRTTENFYSKTFGIKIVFQNYDKKNSMIINCIIDDIIISCLDNEFINKKILDCKYEKPKDPDFLDDSFDNFVNNLNLKDWFIYNNDELYHRYIGYINRAHLIKQKTISQVIKEFLNNDLYNQRKTLITLLLQKNDNEFQYLAYLLYDLLSNENNNNIDTFDQTLLFDSFPWEIKKLFRNAMKNTIKYTKSLSSFDQSKIPIEQQICLLKANDNVKEKAMIKLKEVKAKSEDSGSKARQYLEGLLKIPFGIFKKEKVLEYSHINSNDINNIITKLNKHIDIKFKKKTNYSNLEIKKFIKYFNTEIIENLQVKNIELLISNLTQGKKRTLVKNIIKINSILKSLKEKKHKITQSGKKNTFLKNKIQNVITDLSKNTNFINQISLINKDLTNKTIEVNELNEKISNINKRKELISSSMVNMNQALDDSIYGHNDAKRQVERIIGQWITGKQTGYCFGFEGPPGVGKTSLAKKGLAHCLKDENGEPRPFSFIALGGSSNGSTLSGHNYTYVGSTWGKIVDILMEKKCMNPIIFIDELDKVSKTEHGKEIIGILTHLVDTTQNMSFQDKYFNGIDLDMSKILFIFSYNDVSLIDRILLDRIHRIKFDYLTIFDKQNIVNKFILPEIFENMGIENIISFTEDVIVYIIDNYTNEAGVRKLKEILFEIISEINLKLLKEDFDLDLPITICKDNVDFYLKNRNKVTRKIIHTTNQVGVINGLWANSLGLGGIIPIQTFFYPTNNALDLKLTGMQGDVMKESMNVAKTLAWNLTKKTIKNKILNEKNKEKGIHIHCPEGAIPKDGPSAGTAITVCIYSLLNNKKIKNDVAITGEINLQGKVTEIGGLELKILGAIKAGVKTIIFPKSNIKDYNKFLEKYNTIDISDIKFISVDNINDVLKLVF